MRAMRLHAVGPIESSPLRADDVPVPVAGDGELLVRVQCCAVCRTDLHIVEGDIPAPPRLPVTPGHQVVGRVMAIGPGGARGFDLGERVGIAWLRHTDGTCRWCRQGRENLCPASRYTGYHADGGYAEYATVPADFAYRIPDGFSDEEAAPLLCAGIIGYRAMARANVPDRGRLALFGFGSSAHVVLQIAGARGYTTYVVTRSAGHQQLARALGAAWAGNDAAKLPEKVDSAILFAPVGSLVPPALQCLDRGGTLSLAGIHMSPIPAMNYDRDLYNERDVHPVTANTRNDAVSLLIEAARAGVRPRVTVYPLEDANRALREVKSGKVDGTAVLTLR